MGKYDYSHWQRRSQKKLIGEVIGDDKLVKDPLVEDEVEPTNKTTKKTFKKVEKTEEKD